MSRNPRLDEWLGGWRASVRSAGVQSPGHRARAGWRERWGWVQISQESLRGSKSKGELPGRCTGLGEGETSLIWEERAGHQCYLLRNNENRVLH